MKRISGQRSNVQTFKRSNVRMGRYLTLLLILPALAITSGIALAGLPTTGAPPTQNSKLKTQNSNEVLLTATPTGTATPCAQSWAVMPSLNIGLLENELVAVSVLAPDIIYAVGHAYESGRLKPLIQHWDGSAWSNMPADTVSVRDHLLEGVVALAEDNVWAVGEYKDISNNFRTLVEHWDGRSWTIIPSPNIGVSDNDLFDISAVNEDDIWAVGHRREGNNLFLTLTQHWDGTAWMVVPSPSVEGALNSDLYAVDAFAPDDVWAVGHFRNADGFDQSLTLHWDGASWSIIPSPNVGTDHNHLNDVVMLAPDDVWAVGRYRNASRVNQTLAMHWNGQQWDIVASPNVGTSNNDLLALDGEESGDVWAVGQYRSGTYKTLTQHWDGTAWSTIPSPSNGTSDHELTGLSIAQDEIWAVGWYTSTGLLAHRTLVEKYYACGVPVMTPTVPPGTSTRTPTPGGPPTQTRTSTRTPTAASSQSPVASPTPTVAGSQSPVASVTNTRTPTRTRTPGATNTPEEGTPTDTPEVSETPEVTATPRPPTRTPTITPICLMNFQDVQPLDYFYTSVQYLFCRRIISGYEDNTFRPHNNTTRGQLCKIIVLAEGWEIDPSNGPHFSDVPPTNPFYDFIETAYNNGAISGYGDGSFRPGNNVTRAQLSKIIVIAEQWAIDTSEGPHFVDVPEDNPFYPFVETAYNRGVITGYGCGEICIEFRPGNNATRAQICKIVYNAVTQP